MKYFLITTSFLALLVVAPSQLAGAEPPQFFRQFCFECHNETKAKGHFNFERLAAQGSLGPHAEAWEKVLEMLENGEMPPEEAKRQPSPAERKTATTWVRSNLQAYERAHAGEP